MRHVDATMTQYRYKCVPAPRRAKRTRQHRSEAAALVAAMEEAIAAEAAQGWEYLRTDVVPMERRGGLFSASTETHQGVMVFRRPGSAVVAAWDDASPAARSAGRGDDFHRLGPARTE